jgi:hypothetical protein
VINVTPNFKETKGALKCDILRIEPMIIQWIDGVIGPNIASYHPGRENQEAYEKKKQAVTYGLKKSVVLLQSISRMNERNKKR